MVDSTTGLACTLLVAVGCTSKPADGPPVPAASSTQGQPTPVAPGHRGQPVEIEDAWTHDREQMIELLRSRNIEPPVLEAMARVQRERFVPREVRHQAYDDHPLPIGHDVTISQPYIVALMTQLANIERGDRVLEIGTGSGYQAAVLAAMGAEVYTIEIIEPLAQESQARLKALGYHNVHVRHGDGYAGWPEQAPFDAVLVTAAPPSVPEPLKRQLAVGAKLVIPVGRTIQELLVISRRGQGFTTHTEIPVRFVPMTGKAQNRG